MKCTGLTVTILFAALCAWAASSFFSEPTDLAILNAPSDAAVVEPPLSNNIVAYFQMEEETSPREDSWSTNQMTYTPNDPSIDSWINTCVGIGWDTEETPNEYWLVCSNLVGMGNVWTNNWTYTFLCDAGDATETDQKTFNLVLGDTFTFNLIVRDNTDTEGYIDFTMDGTNSRVAISKKPDAIHFAITKSSSGINLYTNGVLHAQNLTDGAKAVWTNAANAFFYPGKDLPAKIDEVAIWSRVLTTNEIYRVATNNMTGNNPLAWMIGL